VSRAPKNARSYRSYQIDRIISMAVKEPHTKKHSSFYDRPTDSCSVRLDPPRSTYSRSTLVLGGPLHTVGTHNSRLFVHLSGDCAVDEMAMFRWKGDIDHRSSSQSLSLTRHRRHTNARPLFGRMNQSTVEHNEGHNDLNSPTSNSLFRRSFLRPLIFLRWRWWLRLPVLYLNILVTYSSLKLHH